MLQNLAWLLMLFLFSFFAPLGPAAADEAAEEAVALEAAARLGSGDPLAAALSLDGTQIALATKRGVSLYRRDGMTLAWNRETASWCNEVFFSADGARLVTATSEGAVAVWNAADGVSVFEGRTAARRSVALGPDGARLVLMPSDPDQDRSRMAVGTLVVLDVETGEQVVPLADSGGQPERVRFAPDGKSIAAVLDRRRIVVWDAVTGQQRWSVVAGRGLFDFAFHPDGGRLISVLSATTAEAVVWDAATGERLASFDVRGWSVAWSPDGRLIAAGIDRKRVTLLDAGTGETIREWHSSDRQIRELAFARDSRTLLVSNEPVSLWDAHTAELLEAVPEAGLIREVVFSPDGRRLALSGAAVVTVWETESRTRITTFYDPQTGGGRPEFLPGGDRLLVLDDWHVECWDLQTKRLVYRIENVPSGSRSRARLGETVLSPDGRFVAIGRKDHVERIGTRGLKLELWDAESGEKLRDLAVGRLVGRVDGLSFSPDGTRLAMLDHSRAYVFDVESGQTISSWLNGQQTRGVLAWSPDSGVVACAVEENQVALVDPRSGSRLKTLPGGSGQDQVRHLVFSADGRHLAALFGRGAGLEDGVALWDVQSGERLQEDLAPPGSSSVDAVFSPDGRLLAASFGGAMGSGAEGHRVVVWSTETGKAVLVDDARHVDRVGPLEFSPDGKWLLAGSSDGTATLWSVRRPH